jgi:hypothetical protein
MNDIRVFSEEEAMFEDGMAACRINILHEGDRVIGYDGGVVVVRRSNGETDLVRIEIDAKQKRIDARVIATIGYGDGEVELEAEDGDTITYF